MSRRVDGENYHAFEKAAQLIKVWSRKAGGAHAPRVQFPAPRWKHRAAGNVFDEASNTTAGAAVLPNCGSEARAGAFMSGRGGGAGG